MSDRETTFALLPIKGFARGKSRLAAELALTERRELSKRLFLRALRACVGCPLVDHTLVLTESPEVARAARSPRASVLWDPSPRVDFATVLERGLSHAQAQGARRAVVVMADLPTVTPQDVARLASALAEDADAAFAPDVMRSGLGGLSTRLPPRARFLLGRGSSLRRNVDIAHRQGLCLRIVSSPGLAFDVDTPSDLWASGLQTRRTPRG